jgi:hypothetical protein
MRDFLTAPAARIEAQSLMQSIVPQKALLRRRFSAFELA